MRAEPVIGLEIHLQLRTGRKLFCRDRVRFGHPPNTDVCPVCLGLPGALPVVDHAAVLLAMRTAVALGCTVHHRSSWARKSYFYPDLPKGYQITQYRDPLATGGGVAFGGGAGRVRIRRVHLEEDAGKSVHGVLPGGTGVDLNRAGTPLVEIVTEPDLRSPEETRSFLVDLKRLLEYLDVSDCNMEEGSLRVDANVSLREKGANMPDVKTEIKNVNSFSHIEKAISVEVERQRSVRADGGRVEAETLLWDDAREALRPMRSKEELHDYRYFPEPDLPDLIVTPHLVEEIEAELPELPDSRRRRFVTAWGLEEYHADVLTRLRGVADYYEAVAERTDPAEAAKWVMGPLAALQKERGEDPEAFPVPPEALAELLALVEEGAVSRQAAKTALATMAAEDLSAAAVVERDGLTQVSDGEVLRGWVGRVVLEEADAVARYRDGERRVLGYLMGRVMSTAEGAADPHVVRRLLVERLES